MPMGYVQIERDNSKVSLEEDGLVGSDRASNAFASRDYALDRSRVRVGTG
jgi:hypothetical protein